jgi:hypothetical protein
MVGAASGCCAIELRAAATDFPSLSAGNIHPIPVVSPAVIIDAIAITSTAALSIFILLLICCCCFKFFNLFGMLLYGRSDINRGQNAEYISLHHARKQAKQLHYYGYK